jgi:tRNA pseudouridine32 synthase/23S rRNA pseudouridine746 synthase
VNASGVPEGVEVLHADAAMVVLRKPSGLLSVPGRGADKQDCLGRRVQQMYPDAHIVHRLDMATSGLMVMARGADMQRVLNHAFAQRQVDKRYVAVVAGAVSSTTADADGWSEIDLPIIVDWPRRPLRIIDPLHGKPSVTRWRVISDPAAGNNATPAHGTRLELAPVTGRSHQLRVHLQALGHPILGDALYAPPAIEALATRLLLHACTLTLPHPMDGRPMYFHDPAPF